MKPDASCPAEECIECGDTIPVILLRKHIQECHEVNEKNLITCFRVYVFF